MRHALARWTPAGDLVRDRFGRIVEDAFNEMLRPFGSDPEGLTGTSFIPRVDILENADGLVLAMDLPGLTKDDVQLTLENNVLTVSGERKLATEETSNETFHRLERRYGAFSRSFTLGSTVQTDKVEAHFDNGVLTIRLPKQEASKPRRIDIG